MHSYAMLSNVPLVYRCQLFFQQEPFFGDGRFSRSGRMVHGYNCGKLDLMASFNNCSFCSVVGSSAIVVEYYAMSKYKLDVSLGCSRDQLVKVEASSPTLNAAQKFQKAKASIEDM